MDSGLSDCSRCEEDSISCSFNSMDSFAAEKLQTISNHSDPVLTKRITSLEAENERLRIDLGSARIEANARHASNQGLKSKIAELFVEAQNSLQERQKLRNALNDANERLTNIENSFKWYSHKLHRSQIQDKAHQWSIQNDIQDDHLQSPDKNMQLARCSEEKREDSNGKIFSGASHNQLDTICGHASAERHFFRDPSSASYQNRPNEMKEYSEKLQTEPSRSAKYSAGGDILEGSLELVASSQYSCLLFRMNKNLEESEAEKRDILDKLAESQTELFELRKDNEHLRRSMLSSKCEQIQVEEVIVYLRLQLDKLMSQHKMLKARNFETEEKLNAVLDVLEENKRLKSLLRTANSSLLKKLQNEKRRTRTLTEKLGHEQSANRLCNEALQRDERMNSMRDCLRRALERNEVIYQEAHRKLQDWEQLEERLKAKILDESIDEGYGDGSSALPGSVDLPSSPHFDSILIKSAVDVLSRSENFMAPLEQSLDQLHCNIETFRQHVATRTE